FAYGEYGLPAFSGTPDEVITVLPVHEVSTINTDVTIMRLWSGESEQVFLVALIDAMAKIALCVHQPVDKIFCENHCGNPLVTDVRRPPAARCRRGPEQELMEFVLLLEELLKLAQIIRQITENRSGIGV
ncbi:hypothetical protein AH777_25000, partial [Salmonella enterica subsp. enterica serovar Give]|nr:hypothetical protein [Salmonella enterica subsp. enterica serovar Give]